MCLGSIIICINALLYLKLPRMFHLPYFELQHLPNCCYSNIVIITYSNNWL